MKCEIVRRIVAVASVLVLVAVNVMVPCWEAYAAAAVPAIDVEGGLSYLIQMLSSGLGVQVSKASVPALWVAVDAQAKANDPEYMAELRRMCEEEGYISTRELDPSFVNQLLKDLRSVFGSSERQEGSNDFFVTISGEAQAIDKFGTYFSDFRPMRFDYVSAPIYSYYCAKEDLSAFNIFYVSSARFNHASGSSSLFGNYYFYGESSNGLFYLGHYDYYANNPYFIVLPEYLDLPKFKALLLSSDFTLGENIEKVNIAADHVWIDAYDDAALHIPVITAPVSVPLDVTEKEENLKAVSAADDANALYKALATAGIVIDVGTDIPDETEKPTTGDITDDEKVTIGKSLSDILAAITGMADKVAAIPREVANFFTLDIAVISNEFEGLQDAFAAKFAGISLLADVFTKSYSFDMTVPVFTVPVPETLREMFGGQSEIVIMDLRPHTELFLQLRSLLVAMFWVAFAKWLLDQFDVKFHVG